MMIRKNQHPRTTASEAAFVMSRRNKSFLLVLAALTVALFLASMGALTRPASAQVTSADLSISGFAGPDPVEVGQELTYDLSVENSGPDPATSVVVKDTLPAGVEFVSATMNGGDPCTQMTGVLTCNLGDLLDFDYADVQVVVRPTATGTIENVAKVSSNTQDPDATNNESRISTQVKPSQAPVIASAITRNPAFVTGASFVERPPNGQPNTASEKPLLGFPRHGLSYGILTTGSAADATDPTALADTGAGGGNVRGDTDFDVSIMKVDLAVPQTASCLSMDFKFLSEEYPDFVGAAFNDAFIAELDNFTWTTSGSTISSPNNFAFDQNGDVVSINSTGVASMSAQEAAGTPYGGATRILNAKTAITPGAHSLYLSIFDQGDSALDSAAFIDNLNLTADSGAKCQSGVQLPKTDLSISATDTPDPATVGGNLTYTLKATNNGPDPATGVVVKDTLPVGVEFVSASASKGTCSGTDTVSCNVGDLASGASATVTIVVRPTASAVPSISNTATVKGAEQDPDNANNSVTGSTAVGGTPPADTTPPDTTIDSGPTGTVSNKTANFSFSSSETGSTFQCSLDGAPFAACSSPKSYADLSDGQHTFRVKATDAAGNTDATPASRTWTVDATAPTVSSVSPADGATDVAASTNITATFSEAMNAASINGSNFTLTKQGSSSPVAAAVTYDAATKKATLNPNADLEPGATYTATVKGGANGSKDSAGNALAADKTWSSAIVVPSDTTAPKGTVKINGGRAYATSRFVKLTLSANDPSPGSGVASMRLMNDGGTWSDDDWEPYAATTKSWTLRNAQGTRSVSVQYRDETGNVSTTVLDKIILDTVHPKVIKKSPAGAKQAVSINVGAKNVSPFANVTATFSEKMNPRTITNRSIILRRDFGRGRYQSVRAKVTYNARTKTATLNPSVKLAPGAVYVATVFQSNKDLAGNRLDQYTGLRGENGLFWRFQIKK